MMLRCDKCGVEIEGAPNEVGEPCLCAPLEPLGLFRILAPCDGTLTEADE
jgi:hypothetical protein